MSDFHLRWGIAGSGSIANDFHLALSTLDPNHHSIVAVGDRYLEDARKYALKRNIPRYYGSHDELVNDKDIDIIYVATVNIAHKEACLKAINAGKNVLCKLMLIIYKLEYSQIN